MDILDFFWTFYLNHLSPLWGYFYPVSSKASIWEDKLLNDTDAPPVLWKVIFTA